MTILFTSLEVYSRVCNSTGSGNWSNSSTWTCSGGPTCGDTVYVLSGHTVTVNSQQDYETCTSTMVVDVTGILQFTTGNKLRLPCGSLLSLQSGGILRKSTPGGGSSTLVSICGTTVWDADDGTITGPTGFGGFVLPVELLRLEAQREEDELVISWSTASESRNDFFEVYGQSAGDNWRLLERVEGQGNSNTESNYSITLKIEDLTVVRLDQVDFDGSRNTLGEIDVKDLSQPDFADIRLINQASGISLWIPPTTDISRIQVWDIYGRLIEELEVQSESELTLVSNGSPFVLVRFLNTTGEAILTRKVLTTF